MHGRFRHQPSGQRGMDDVSWHQPTLSWILRLSQTLSLMTESMKVDCYRGDHYRECFEHDELRQVQGLRHRREHEHLQKRRYLIDPGQVQYYQWRLPLQSSSLQAWGPPKLQSELQFIYCFYHLFSSFLPEICRRILLPTTSGASSTRIPNQLSLAWYNDIRQALTMMHAGRQRSGQEQYRALFYVV